MAESQNCILSHSMEASGAISALSLPLEFFTQRNFVAHFILLKLFFIHKNDKVGSIL